MPAVKGRLTTSEPLYYIWSFPGSPIKIHLELELVKRMQARFHLAGSTSAAAGLLLGETDGQITSIRDFHPLSKNDGGEVTQAIAALTPAPGKPAIVGYYRTQQDDTLHLNEQDLLLAEALFRDPHQVFLLVQATDSGPGNASFFFREGGRMNGDFPFLEFPFDADLLASAERHKAETAQRRTVLNIPLAPVAAPPPAARNRRRTVWKAVAWSVFAASIVAAAFVSIRLYPGKFPRLLGQSYTSVASAALARPSLGLQAERQSGDLKLTWSRDSAAIAAATSGVVSIQDGASRREFQLQEAQVRSGSILYSPVSDQVQLQLTVSGQGGSATESVIVILPKAGPLQVQQLNPQPVPARRPQPPQPVSHEASRAAPAKPFTPPPVANRGPAAPAVMADEPPALTANAISAPAAPALLNRQIQVPAGQPPAQVTPAPPSKQAPPQTQSPAVLAYRPPEVIRQVMPSFPPSLKPVILKDKVVEVTVSIDATGKVTKAIALPQKDVHLLLIGAAQSAARQWKFQPARRGDQMVPSEMVLRFNFKATR